MRKAFKFVSALALATVSLPVVAENSPYISKVYEYCPAPGQFVNLIPEFEAGDTHESILGKVEEQICGAENDGMISLGAFGGYVVFGFDHPLVNLPGEYDFKIFGNAFVGDMNALGGSCEPGIVMVSVDENGNGLPDDRWYELAGSDYAKPTTIRNYKIKYFRPSADHVATPDPEDKAITDNTYIRWESETAEGYVMKNTEHSQPYWPEWVDADALEFEGTKLADNFIDVKGDGSYFVQTFLEWGYADNLPNYRDPGFKIDWAVDESGNPVQLDKVDFIRVHTAVNQYCGRIGETSTEICGARDLHPEATASMVGIESDVCNINLVSVTRSSLRLHNVGDAIEAYVYSTDGRVMAVDNVECGDSEFDISALSSGVYVFVADGYKFKFAK